MHWSSSAAPVTPHRKERQYLKRNQTSFRSYSCRRACRPQNRRNTKFWVMRNGYILLQKEVRNPPCEKRGFPLHMWHDCLGFYSPVLTPCCCVCAALSSKGLILTLSLQGWQFIAGRTQVSMWDLGTIKSELEPQGNVLFLQAKSLFLWINGLSGHHRSFFSWSVLHWSFLSRRNASQLMHWSQSWVWIESAPRGAPQGPWGLCALSTCHSLPHAE